MFISSAVVRVINQQLSADQRQAFADHTGRHVGLQLRGYSLVFRITHDGYLAAASPLIDADVVVVWRNAQDGFCLQGSIGLLNTLSTVWGQIDWSSVVMDAFGPFVGPRLLFAMGRSANAVAQRTIDQATMADYKKRLQRLHDDVSRLSTRLSALSENRG